MHRSFPTFASATLLLLVLGCDDGRRRAGGDASVVDTGLDAADAARDLSIDATSPDSGLPEDAGMAMDSAMDAPSSGSRPGPGDIVVVEIQGNPVRANDEDAEYIELLNVSDRALDLRGVRLAWRSFSAGSPEPSAEVHDIAESVILAPGARALLARSAGGFFGGEPDHVYEGVLFMNGDLNRLRVLTPSWDGSEPPNAADLIDEVIIESDAFENDVRGRSYQFNEAALAPSASSNDDASNWCTSSTADDLEYRSENFGTPGEANEC